MTCFAQDPCFKLNFRQLLSRASLTHIMSRKPYLSSESKAIALNVVKICKEEKLNGQLFVPLCRPVARASLLTGIPERSLNRFASMSNGEKTLRKPRSDKIVVDDFDRCVIRRTINNMLVSRKTLPTVNAILNEIRSPNSIEFKGKKTALKVILKEMGFRWRKCTDNRTLLMERSDIVAQRINFLRKIKCFREEGRDIVYTDETYVNAGHTVSKCWQTNQIGLSVPFNKGERMILLHAGSKNGFISGAKLVFKAKSTTGDYHSEMNFENFKKWLQEKLLPNLQPNSVIVLDNAAYHNVQQDKCPTAASRKAVIQEWLSRHNITYSPDMLKAELLELCKRNKTAPVYVIDQILQKHGHTALRLPPYHADLNAIELIWSDIKGYVARKNLSFKFTDVKVLIEEAFQKVTCKKWANCCSHVEGVEKNYWLTDIAVEKELDGIVIKIDSDDSSSDFDELSDYDNETEDDARVSAYETETELDYPDTDTETYDVADYLDTLLTADSVRVADTITADNTLTADDTLTAYDTLAADDTLTADNTMTADSTLTADDTMTA